MRILYIDIDTLRPDHLGCYGYQRNTSPNIDALAARGVRFTRAYVSDAPCLPSRTALFTCRPGIQTGVVNHGGRMADIRPQGPERAFNNVRGPFRSWMQSLASAGLHTCTISPFATRHAAWHFLDGFREWHDTGRLGHERADEIVPVALDWIRRNARRDGWFLHVNFWDPHTPYRTPLEYGNPFQDIAAPDWLTEEILERHRRSYGPHSARDLFEFGPYDTQKWPRVPAEIASLADFKKWIDGYDTGIRYADDHVGLLLNALAEEGVLDETVIIVSSDHGENQGELNVYGDHQTADHHTCNIPLIVAGPGIMEGRVDHDLHYHLDLAPTIAEMAGAEAAESWEGRSFLPALTEGRCCGRQSLVISQGAWALQRSVVFDRWLLMRTYDPGLKDFPEVMLFNLQDDPHETRDRAGEHTSIVAQGTALIEFWVADQMKKSGSAEDPFWAVMREGGPLHTRGQFDRYAARLRETGREDCITRMAGGKG